MTRTSWKHLILRTLLVILVCVVACVVYGLLVLLSV